MTEAGPRWTCDRCRKPIVRGGFVAVRWDDAIAYPEAVARWHATHPGIGATGGHTLAEFEDYPAPVHWHVLHGGPCDSMPGNVYSLALDDMRTWRGVVARTAHLIGKGWITSTDWGELLYRIGAA